MNPVAQLFGELAKMDILDLFKGFLDLLGVFLHQQQGLRMVKDLVPIKLALGMNEMRNTGSLPVYDRYHAYVGGRWFNPRTDQKLS